MGFVGDIDLTEVAPRAGAWIETAPPGHQVHNGRKSLPVRERGLKQEESRCDYQRALSLPVRERGLKPRPAQIAVSGSIMSLPVRERGLKRV